MKKLKSVLKGLPECEKTRPFATFPRIFWDMHSLILPKKFTMKMGEGPVTALKNPIELAFSRQSSTPFDITLNFYRRHYATKGK
jgi:hypothetical protein